MDLSCRSQSLKIAQNNPAYRPWSRIFSRPKGDWHNSGTSKRQAKGRGDRHEHIHVCVPINASFSALKKAQNILVALGKNTFQNRFKFCLCFWRHAQFSSLLIFCSTEIFVIFEVLRTQITYRLSIKMFPSGMIGCFWRSSLRIVSAFHSLATKFTTVGCVNCLARCRVLSFISSLSRNCT